MLAVQAISQEEVTMVAVQLARSGRFQRAVDLEEELVSLCSEATASQLQAALHYIARAYSWMIPGHRQEVG